MRLRQNQNGRASTGFTLVELIIVLSIILLLSALSLPAVQKVRDAGNRVHCVNNMRQVGIALHGYHNAYGVLPPGLRNTSDPYPFMAWCTRILPYIDQQPLWLQAQADFKKSPIFWSPSSPPHVGVYTVLTVYVCPADGRSLGHVEPENGDVAFTHYLGVMGLSSGSHDGVLYLDSKVSLRDIVDGTSNTLMVGERPPGAYNRFGWWYAGVGQELDGSADSMLGVEDYRTTYRTPTCPFGPYYFGPGSDSNPCDTFHFWSRHPGGAHFLYADGSVHFLSYSARSVLPALSTRAGREVVGLP